MPNARHLHNIERPMICQKEFSTTDGHQSSFLRQTGLKCVAFTSPVMHFMKLRPFSRFRFKLSVEDFEPMVLQFAKEEGNRTGRVQSILEKSILFGKVVECFIAEAGIG
jgi:hypothetical protein